MLVVGGLLMLIYAFGLRLEENRNEHTAIQTRIDRIEEKLSKEREVDIFARQLRATGIDILKE